MINKYLTIGSIGLITIGLVWVSIIMVGFSGFTFEAVLMVSLLVVYIFSTFQYYKNVNRGLFIIVHVILVITLICNIVSEDAMYVAASLAMIPVLYMLFNLYLEVKNN